ncbi:hypothetical protein LCGC14_1773610 [marine sediment metagenome]|uniref:Uncharacterized protein n=1 Tax=marine sediment metagenome TaxID=412755 RepID=A0A0F9HK07_9ZZZZ|nr:hypothetical protein [Desulfobacterales bacterium]
MAEWMGWSNQQPKESGLYWWKAKTWYEDWTAIVVTESEKNYGFWKPARIDKGGLKNEKAKNQ